jgi:hypothetical protein
MLLTFVAVKLMLPEFCYGSEKSAIVCGRVKAS